MPTINDWSAVEQLIINNGRFEDDPQVYRITEYTDRNEGKNWGLDYGPQWAYSPSDFVINPQIIWGLEKDRFNIIKRSNLSGLVRSAMIEMYPQDFKKFLNGELIQVALPYLTAEEREFILTGITPEEWEQAFPPEEDEDEEGENDSKH